MAKHVILESYTFTPGTNIVITGKYIRREQLLLITNVTRGIVIYNFSDPSLGAVTYTNSTSTLTGLETTTIVTSYSTSSMSSTDKLSILVEETYTEMVPAEAYMDPVGKMRVSQPQALIDTDFEYGLQPTKWETINLLSNRPTSFYDATQPIPISAMTASTNTVTVTAQTFTATSTGVVATALVTQITGMTSVAGLYPGMNIIKQSGTGAFGAGLTTIISIDSATAITIQSQASNTTGALVFTAAIPTVGQTLFVQGSLDIANADGWWICNASTASTGIFTYQTYSNPITPLIDTTKTYIFTGTFYTGAVIPTTGTTSITLSGTAGTVTTTNGHGLQVGNHIFLTGITSTTAINNISAIITTTPTNNTFTFATTVTGTPATTANGTVYSKATGFNVHRAWDGGVQFANGYATHGYQIIRQTRRYFRYQSGKGMQFSTGSIMKPQLWQDSITASGTTVTVACKIPHGLSLGAFVTITGCNETAYNGTFQVVTTPSVLQFTYTALSTPSLATATGFPIYISPASWYGGKNRLGMFDNQNGLFYEFDGQTLYAVRRSSTYQLSGVSAVTNYSTTVTGTGTYFSNQLKPGDYIVIRGMSYLVTTIISDTSMQINPEYRGITSSNVVVSKTIDLKFPQSAWNIDKADGTGHSGFNLDLTKMQMFYMDYSWYGAGEIRFGFRNTRGEIMYVHRIPNNNLNYLAWMRSGNMCGRYETNTLSLTTYLTGSLTSGATTGATITGQDFSTWPSSGTAMVTASGATGAVIEYITYSAKSTTTTNYNTLTILARAATGGQASAQNFTLTGVTTSNLGGGAPIMISLYSPQVASAIDHWGSSVIMDGRYDDDKSLVFNVGVNTAFSNLPVNQRIPLISLRTSPSADSGLTGVLGQREIINRMQLILRQMDVATTGASYRIDIMLNSIVSGGVYTSAGGSSLAQYAIHTTSQTIAGGESVFSFFTNTGSTSTVTQQDLSLVRDLGTNILGGGVVSSNVPVLTAPTTANGKYPDGPDVITICATAIGSATNTIVPRISWTEAQA
jgi:hypothetical protein